MSKAAVFTEVGKDLEIWDLDLAAPKHGEIKVRILASGVCHSDLSVQNGTLPLMPPIVLGHEGAGIVEEVGPGCDRIKEGDHVVLAWVPQCGHCYTCGRGQPELCETSFLTQASGGLLDGTPRFSKDGSPVHHMSTSGTFTEHTVVPEVSAVKVGDDLPLDKLCLIGCGVLTGWGAAVNTAKVRPGDSVAVIGCGGVGLNTIQGARIAGAEQIIAVDMVDSKLELARTFGATDTVNAGDGDAVAQVQSLTGSGPLGPRGVDYAFEVVGAATTMQQAIDMVRRGGTAVQVGAPKMDEVMNVSPFFVWFAGVKNVIGSFYGSSTVHKDIPILVDLYRKGDLLLDELVSKTIKLDDVNAAFDDMKTGTVARSVITSF